jgi:hypothetical protein
MSTRRTASQPATTPALFLAELQTRSFVFHALGTTEAKALAALRKTWEAHAAQYARSVLNPVRPWAEIVGPDAEEVRITALTPDAIGTRDGRVAPMTLSPAYGNVGGTRMHAAPLGVPNTTADALCGATYVIRARGDYAAAVNAQGALATYCPTCLRAAVALMS